jgi:amino acid ABC transporter substrate-binding protein, PAAT family (TC 3.A.1.3.-)
MHRLLKTTLAAAAMCLALASTASAGSKLQEILDAGTIRIGVSLGGEPIGFRDDQNNPVGYDVDVATCWPRSSA